MPEVTRTGLALSLQPIGLLGDILTSVLQQQQQQLGAHITPCCLSRFFTAVGELAHTQRSRAEKREKKVRDSAMHWVTGMPNYNHLWWYNHSSVKLHSRLTYPPSLTPAALPLSLSDMSETGNLTLESQVSTSSEESLSFHEFLFEANLRALSPF